MHSWRHIQEKQFMSEESRNSWIEASYAAYVESALDNERKRQQANISYLSVISAIIVFSSNLDAIKPEYPLALTLIICVIWFSTILRFRQISQSKYRVIANMEAMKETRPFTEEWDGLSGNTFLKELSMLEMAVPIAIFVFVIVRTWMA
jgi:hypothetical protein